MSDTPQVDPTEKEFKVRARKNLTYLLLFAIVMFFAGLTSAYIVSMSSGYWVHVTLPKAFLVSTVVIVLSSITMQLALVSARKDKRSIVPIWVLATLACGIVFTWSQVGGWKELMAKGNYAVGHVLDNKGVYGQDFTFSKGGQVLVLVEGNYYLPTDMGHSNALNAELEESKNTASSYLYVLTFAHLAHLLAGLLALVVILFMAFGGRYTGTDHVGLWAGTIYWHFLTGLWVFLFSFLTFLH